MKYLQIPLPGETSFNQINNNMNQRNYNFIKKEFKISNDQEFYIDEPWPYNYNPNLGFWEGITGKASNYGHPDKYPHMFTKDWDEGRENMKKQHDPPHNFFYWVDKEKSKKTFNVLKQTDYPRYIKFIPKKTDYLTPTGIQRLNDSIRTFVYCVLGAQADARSPIIGSAGTKLDAQKQFLKLLDDSINQHADIPTSIKNYQDAISKAHVRLNYVIAPGLYIISSDMVLKFGEIENYNNNIQIATQNMTSGKNDINKRKTTLTQLMEGPPVKTFRTKVKDITHQDEINKEPDKSNGSSCGSRSSIRTR